MIRGARLDADYVLPLRWSSGDGVDELSAYLRKLSGWIPIIVVDGSNPADFEEHRLQWSPFATVCAPEEWPAENGKVAGVMTGLRMARHSRVVIADDDVRYTLPALQAVVAGLDRAEIVRPQNYFQKLPWHARWDTGRTLINRAIRSDYPGTLGVRADLVLSVGGYSGAVLFENLELIRTVRAAGGRETRLDDVFVARLPPSARHFAAQRVRQAYDDFAQPLRLIAELAILPVAIWALRRPARLAIGIGLVIAVAERGRTRGSGGSVFPATSALWAPLWLAERAVCVWLAVVARARGGVTYRGNRLREAAHPRRVIAAHIRHHTSAAALSRSRTTGEQGAEK